MSEQLHHLKSKLTQPNSTSPLPGDIWQHSGDTVTPCGWGRGAGFWGEGAGMLLRVPRCSGHSPPRGRATPQRRPWCHERHRTGGLRPQSWVTAYRVPRVHALAHAQGQLRGRRGIQVPARTPESAPIQSSALALPRGAGAVARAQETGRRVRALAQLMLCRPRGASRRRACPTPPLPPATLLLSHH